MLIPLFTPVIFSIWLRFVAEVGWFNLFSIWFFVIIGHFQAWFFVVLDFLLYKLCYLPSISLLFFEFSTEDFIFPLSPLSLSLLFALSPLSPVFSSFLDGLADLLAKLHNFFDTFLLNQLGNKCCYRNKLPVLITLSEPTGNEKVIHQEFMGARQRNFWWFRLPAGRNCCLTGLFEYFWFSFPYR